eukprot:766780-Hanusia_phi.AAC.2
MVPSEEHDLARAQGLLREQVSDDLEIVRTTVNVVSEKQEVGRGQGRADPPQSFLERDEVLVVAVQVSEDVAGSTDMDAPRLSEADLPHVPRDRLDVAGQERLLHRALHPPAVCRLLFLGEGQLEEAEGFQELVGCRLHLEQSPIAVLRHAPPLSIQRRMPPSCSIQVHRAEMRGVQGDRRGRSCRCVRAQGARSVRPRVGSRARKLIPVGGRAVGPQGLEALDGSLVAVELDSVRGKLPRRPTSSEGLGGIVGGFPLYPGVTSRAFRKSVGGGGEGGRGRNRGAPLDRRFRRSCGWRMRLLG